MKTPFQSRIQVATAARGENKYWVARVLQDGDEVFTQTESWRTTKNGGESQHIVSAKKRIYGKNIGRANETTPLKQAIAEVNALVLKQQDKGYWNEGEIAPVRRALPMLALKYQDRKHNVVFPCFVQPKLDGGRALMDGKEMWSRNGKLYPPEVQEIFLFETGGDSHETTLDGELMLPKPYTFQDIMSATKNKGKNDDPEELERVAEMRKVLEYHVFDIVDPDQTFTERYDALRHMKFPNRVKLVPVKVVKNESEMMKLHDEFLAAGYEGIMVRNADGLYKLKDRSKDLLKYKTMETEEFEVIDVIDGEGKDEGHAIFVCRMPSGKTFPSHPNATMEQRRAWFKQRESLIGKMLTVQHQPPYTDEGLPRFNRALGFRADLEE